MKIVGCDVHTRYQQIAMLDDETRVSGEEMRASREAARTGVVPSK